MSTWELHLRHFLHNNKQHLICQLVGHAGGRARVQYTYTVVRVGYTFGILIPLPLRYWVLQKSSEYEYFVITRYTITHMLLGAPERSSTYRHKYFAQNAPEELKWILLVTNAYKKLAL